ncbi:hypothetical protein C8N35_110159 [Breoghania corrubedonensis]|uniref:DUF5330 domain-containing protein n=1 Tax=Breoghania corrubedonensis TaxID=665038 RepID=A0A2T5V1S1_9HYPH|nr:DUF5330 domain-containing protein [Breoghania corrubedonensis]PTW57680.1 hypothetical protein C8N35_110159 [Breoghania corrubedonensis]
MFFLLRTAFWLSLVILLIPADASTGDNDKTQISALQALGAAQQTYVDMTRFCERNTTACEAGGAALEVFGAKARTGARMIYQYLDPEGRAPDATATGSINADTAGTAGAPSASRYPDKPETAAGTAAPLDSGTLTARDRAPAWVPPLPQDKPA